MLEFCQPCVGLNPPPPPPPFPPFPSLPFQVLHDAFFKHQSKPKLSGMGELYYEGKEFEAQVWLVAIWLCSQIPGTFPEHYSLSLLCIELTLCSADQAVPTWVIEQRAKACPGNDWRRATAMVDQHATLWATTFISRAQDSRPQRSDSTGGFIWVRHQHLCLLLQLSCPLVCLAIGNWHIHMPCPCPINYAWVWYLCSIWLLLRLAVLFFTGSAWHWDIRSHNCRYHPGGWGKPPVDEQGNPVYGDVFGVAPQSTLADSIQHGQHWGELESEDEESEDEDEEEEDEMEEVNSFVSECLLHELSRWKQIKSASCTLLPCLCPRANPYGHTCRARTQMQWQMVTAVWTLTSAACRMAWKLQTPFSWERWPLRWSSCSWWIPVFPLA